MYINLYILFIVSIGSVNLPIVEDVKGAGWA